MPSHAVSLNPESFTRCNVLSQRAGVAGRLGVYSGDPWLWLDASTASDLVHPKP